MLCLYRCLPDVFRLCWSFRFQLQARSRIGFNTEQTPLQVGLLLVPQHDTLHPYPGRVYIAQALCIMRPTLKRTDLILSQAWIELCRERKVWLRFGDWLNFVLLPRVAVQFQPLVFANSSGKLEIGLEGFGELGRSNASHNVSGRGASFCCLSIAKLER